MAGKDLRGKNSKSSFKITLNFARLLLFVLAITCIVPAAKAQQNQKSFSGRDGRIGITAYIDGNELKLGSTQLRTIIDFETLQVTLKLDPSTLLSQVPEIDSKLSKLQMDEVIFRGKMDIPFINPNGEATQDFAIPGKLTVDGITLPVELKATLSHVNQAPAIRSVLYLHYDLPLADFELADKLPDFGEFGCIEILHPVITR